MMNKRIEDNIDELQAIRKKNSVVELYIFGSALTKDFSDHNDLDFANVLKENLTPIEYGDAFFGLMEDLESLFERNIDLVSYWVIKNPIFKQEVDRTKKSLCAAA